MKITRKFQEQLESKIKHHLATGVLPVIKREAETGAATKSHSHKTDASQGK